VSEEDGGARGGGVRSSRGTCAGWSPSSLAIVLISCAPTLSRRWRFASCASPPLPLPSSESEGGTDAAAAEAAKASSEPLRQSARERPSLRCVRGGGNTPWV
jgi:hypothetical protein